MKTNKKIIAYILRFTTTALLFSCVLVALCSAISNPPSGRADPIASKPTGCIGPYIINQIGDSIVAGTTDIGNHTDDGSTFISLPFSFQLYENTYAGVNVGSNGNAQFVTMDGRFATNICLPWNEHDDTIFPYWDDLRTDAQSGCAAFPGGTCGVFTSTTGTAPDRIFNIEWRTVYFDFPTETANFELRLYEGQTRFDVIYGAVALGNISATAGVQHSCDFTEYFCIGSGGAATGGQSYILPCGTPSPTPTPPCVPPPPNMVSWWPGDGNTDDIVDGNVGRFVGNPVYSTGEVGQAFSFDGSNYVDVPDAPNLDFKGAAPITIDMWVYRTGTAPVMHFIGKREDCGLINYQMAFDFNGLSFGGHGGGVVTGRNLPCNTWTHLTGTFDGSTIRFYINGELVGEAAATSVGPTNDAPLRIGTSGTCENFVGLIDEVELFNRALSQAEIQAIVDAGSAGKCKGTSTPTPTPSPSPTATTTATATATITPSVTPTPSFTPRATPIPRPRPTPVPRP